jgi:hypothetical protein
MKTKFLAIIAASALMASTGCDKDISVQQLNQLSVGKQLKTSIEKHQEEYLATMNTSKKLQNPTKINSAIYQNEEGDWILAIGSSDQIEVNREKKSATLKVDEFSSFYNLTEEVAPQRIDVSNCQDDKKAFVGQYVDCKPGEYNATEKNALIVICYNENNETCFISYIN